MIYLRVFGIVILTYILCFILHSYLNHLKFKTLLKKYGKEYSEFLILLFDFLEKID